MKPVYWKSVFFASFLLGVFSSASHAEIVSGRTEALVVSQSGAREAVCINLISQGASPQEAAQIVERMSAQEILYFEADPARSQPGGFIVFLLVVTVLVLLIVFLARRV